MHVYRSREEGIRSKGGYDVWEYGSGRVHGSAATGEKREAIRALADAEASFAIVTNLIGEPRAGADPTDDLRAFNEWTCALARTGPQFIPFVSIDRRWQSLDAQIETVRALVESGDAKGIKLHPPVQGLDVCDPSTWPLFEACSQLDVPIISHSGPTRSGRGRGEPNDFRPLLEHLPNLRLSLAHLGGGAWTQVAKFALDHDSIYFDCCEIIEWLGAPQAPSATQFVSLVREIGVGRVMMGSDFPWYEPSHTIGQIQELPFSEGEKTAILGENAAAFLRL
jgi:hypothetical protein